MERLRIGGISADRRAQSAESQGFRSIIGDRRKRRASLLCGCHMFDCSERRSESESACQNDPPCCLVSCVRSRLHASERPKGCSRTGEMPACAAAHAADFLQTEIELSPSASLDTEGKGKLGRWNRICGHKEPTRVKVPPFQILDYESNRGSVGQFFRTSGA